MNSFHPNNPEANMMTQNRDPFGLASLPELQPPEDSWSNIAAQLQSRQRRRQRWLSGLAIAATVTLVAGIVSVLPQIGETPLPAETTPLQAENDPAPTQSSVAGEPAPTVVGGGLPPTEGYAAHTTSGQAADQLQSLQKLSQRLEQNLVVLRSGVGAMPAEMVVYQVELEDLVAQVDAAIGQYPDSSVLWQQRVSLLLDLNQIYGAGLRREEPYVASL
jgi:hypothetical protein